MIVYTGMYVTMHSYVVSYMYSTDECMYIFVCIAYIVWTYIYIQKQLHTVHYLYMYVYIQLRMYSSTAHRTSEINILKFFVQPSILSKMLRRKHLKSLSLLNDHGNLHQWRIAACNAVQLQLVHNGGWRMNIQCTKIKLRYTFWSACVSSLHAQMAHSNNPRIDHTRLMDNTVYQLRILSYYSRTFLV